ncbi:ribulose-phosphate 3-epimerase [Candidatus Sumerlaeota bacterium]|nr:ribulose-phosphate 3-epimerase [Candidatus Sumerlaeota bacterium]
MTRKRRKPSPPPARGRAVHLAPSILSADFKDLRSALVSCRQADCRWIHLDVMDGHFVGNVSFGPGVIESIRSVGKDFFFDVHLMVTDPRMYIKPLVQAGAQCVTFHIEAAREDTSNLLRHIRRQGLQAGLSLRPRTPVAEIIPHFEHADLVLVMTVEPGFGGQKLIPATLNKVRELVHLREKFGLSFMIQVDGGINPDTAPLAVAAGSDVLVAGSSVFRGGKVKENVKHLRRSIAQIR